MQYAQKSTRKYKLFNHFHNERRNNLREKSGAGLLNIPAAIRMAQSNTYYSYTFYPTEAIYDSSCEVTAFLLERK